MYKIRTLNNNLRLISVPRNSMRSASIIFCVGAGSSDENETVSGVAHFIEHVSFRGTSSRDMVSIKKPIEEVGGTLNAFTGNNLTIYYAKVPSTEVMTAVEILSDIVFKPLFNEADIEKEKDVIYEEISMYEDDPVDNVFENLFRNIYNPEFARPIIGNRKNVENFDKSIITGFYNKFYKPSNVTVVLTGSYEEDKIADYLSLFEGKENFISEMKSPQLKNKNIIVEKTKKDLSQHYIVNAFKAPSRSDEGYYPSLVLNTLLGSGMSSLLFNRIREEKSLVYEVTSEYNAYKKSGVFLVFAATSGDKLTKYNNELENVLKSFYSDKDAEQWFNYGKKRLIGKLTIDIESNVSLGMNILDLYLNNKEPITIDDVIKNIESVTLSQVLRAAGDIFEGNKYVSVLKPE